MYQRYNSVHRRVRYMLEKFHQILEKIKNRRAASAAVMAVFAALLTVGAVTGQQKINAMRTTTGTPGTVSVSSIKSFGGSQFVSDYQGAYFYILPDAIDYTYGNDLETAFGGTLFKTGRNKTETYRDIWKDFQNEKGDFSYLDAPWQNQYLFTRWQGRTTVPAQTKEALMFVPEATWEGTSLKSGWKANESAICYYNPDASSPEDSYKVTTDQKYLKNRIFAPGINLHTVQGYCDNGIFYNDLAKWTADKDKNLSESDLSIKGLQKKFSTKKAIKNYVKKSTGKQSQAYTLWCYITSFNGDNATLVFAASEKIDQFIFMGYQNSFQKRNRKYDKNNNPIGVGLKDGLNGKYELKELTSRRVNDDVFTKNKFAQREYNLHMLDLMLCAYATAVKQGATTSVQNAWLDAIYDYVNYDVFQSSTVSPAFPIAICGGTIARGANQDKNGKTVNQIVYVGTQDLVNFAGLMENAGNDTKHYGELKVNSRSMTKSLIAPRLGGSGSSSAYLLRMHTFADKLNKEAFKFGRHTAEKTNNQIGKFELIKKLPDYYTSYYKRMKSAMSGGEVGKVTNLESTSAAEIQSWHSNVVLRAVINTMYTRDKKGNIREVKAKSDFRESIKLTKQLDLPSSSNVIYQFKDAWGALFIPSYLWPVENTKEASFGVVLTVRSTLYAQGKAGKDNTTAVYTDAEFPDPSMLKTKDDKKYTWQENWDQMNDRKDFVVSTRELKDNGTEAEAFQNNKETVQLQAQVVYRTKKDKEKFKRWYNSMDKNKLKVTMTVTPLYGKNGEYIQTAKGDKNKVKCVPSWNTSYTGTTAKRIGVTLENGKGTKLKLLNGRGCKVSKTDFKSIFLPTSGLQGVKMTLDTDKKFFKNTGFEVPTSKNGKKYVCIGYQIKLTADCVKDGTTQEYKEDATSNKAGIRYSRKLVIEGEEEEMSPSYNYTSIPEDFCELKEGSVYNEQFEAMAGVPSTRSLYFSTGGSEFIVNMRSNYEANQRAERKYTSHFNGTECEYKKGDQLKSQSADNTLPETFVGDSNDNTISKQVNAQINKAIVPTGATSSKTSVSDHWSATTFKAEWKGTIENKTEEPANIGRFSPGKAGDPCAGNNYSEGTQRTKGTAVTKWDTAKYNSDIDNAIAWAQAMERTNRSYTVKRIADSDGQIRLYRVGDAVIKVTLTGGDKKETTECGTSKSYTGGTYTSSTASGAKTQAGDSARLGSGWSYTAGKKGSGSGYHAGAHGHGGTCPGNDKKTGEDAHGNPTWGPCGDEHNCGTFTPGTDITQGASEDFSYTITVTFKNGKVLSGGNYDGASELSGSEKTVGSSLPAHALCGPCCCHNLPAVEDKWTQIVYFDTMAISDLQVWKIESGYVQGTSEITQGNRYYEENKSVLATINDTYDAESEGNTPDYDEENDEEPEDWENLGDSTDTDEEMVLKDRLYSEITQSDPNVFYNIAARNVDEGYGEYNTSRVGRLRYSLQTGQDDNVYYEEKNAKGELHRSNKCDGQDSTRSEQNPVPSAGKGHDNGSWSKGCLYTNNKFVNCVDYHANLTNSKKRTYNSQNFYSKKVDAIDKNTEEWKRFDTRRHQKVNVTVISDFLILQTSSGDQSVLYHQGTSKTVDAQENFGEVEVDTSLNNETGFVMMHSNNSLAMKQGTAINIGSYNGNYNTPSTKYRGSGNGERIATAFDDDSAKYNNITDELGKANVSAKHLVSNSANTGVSCPGVGQARLPRVNGLIITKNPVIQCPTNVNKEYTTGLSFAFYKPIIKYTDGGTRYSSLTREDDNKEQEKLREKENRTITDRNVVEYRHLNYKRTTYMEAGYGDDKDNFLEDEIAMMGAVSPDDEIDSKYLRALGKESYGILLRSIYTRGKTKCNDIVVHDPVSTENVRVMRAAGQGADLDQRTVQSYQDAGGAAQKNKEAAEEGTCPGIPGECNFRVLNCKYGQEIVRGAFDIDTYSKTLITEDDGTDEGGESTDKPEPVYTENDYTYTIYSSVVNDNGGNASVPLAGSGFRVVAENGGTPPEDPDSINQNYWLKGEGKASLPFEFYKFNIDSGNSAERVKLEAYFTIHREQKMPLFTTAHTQLYVDSDGYLSVKTDDGAEYRSTEEIIKMGRKYKIGFSIYFGSISRFTVTVYNEKVRLSQIKYPSATIYEDEVCGPEFFIGNNETTSYDINMSVDNIKVTRLPGTTSHTDACYKTETMHSSTIQDTYNGITETSGNVIDWTRKNDDGSARVGSENNTHTHTSNCLTKESEGFNIAYKNGIGGDTTDMEKMVGPKLWKFIASHFSLDTDKNGKYTFNILPGIEGIKADDVFEYEYTGNIRSITLPEGKYKLEAWGAQGGKNQFLDGVGGKGGYSKGVIELNQKTRLYIGVGGSGNTFNGGGQGQECGASGGGATHFATMSGELSTLSRDKREVLLVAGGGGGAQRYDGGAGGGANQHGVQPDTGCGTAGEPGTLSSGYAFGKGGPSKAGSDGSYGGAGGGGFYGGDGATSDVSNVDDKGGSGGSGYANVSKLSSIRGETGVNAGNGKARITVISVKPKKVGKDELFTFINNHRDMIPDTVTTNGYTIINPIWDCKCAFDKHVCSSDCKTIKELVCNEPHHQGKHYDYSSRICYDACCNDANHKQYKTEVTDERGKTIRADDFILLDNYFDVYFPNRGDYYNLDSYGILDTQINRGKGYTNNMDTTEWTREKWIKFPYSVLYNRNGIWEEHPADEWFQIEIFDRNGNTLDTYHFYCQLKNREMGSAEIQYAVEAVNHETYPGEVEKMLTTEFYHERHINGLYPYEKDDELTILGPVDGSEPTNKLRREQGTDERYWAYEDCWNHTWIDVIGRIGNILVEDTDDLRFSNYYKEPTNDGWLIDGVLRTVDQNIQNRYMSWWRNNGTPSVDIRGLQASSRNEWYNTWNTMEWTDIAASDGIPVQASKNTVRTLRNEANELRLGYNVLWDISSMGNYENGTLQVIPYYYALNTKTGEITPVDVYADSGSTVLPINYSGLFNAWADGSGNTQPPKDFTELSTSLYAYNMSLNWQKESGRRNYKEIEKDHTEQLATDTHYGTFAYDGNGNLVMRPVTTYDEETGTYESGENPLVYNLTIPYGDVDFVLGTEQLLYVNCEPTANGDDGGRARTFIGSPRVTALHTDINGDNNTNLLGTTDKDYYLKAQRWHLTLGLPSSAKFVAYRGGKHLSPNDTITTPDGNTIYAADEFKPDDKGACDYVILMTADIKVLGDTYNLEYRQGKDNGVYRASNGNVFKFGDEIPTLIAVYGIGDTTTPDLDIMQTH